MKRLQIFVATLLLAGVALPALAQTYNPDSLKNVGGWLTGSDLKYSGTSVVSNGGAVDTNGSNKYYGDVFIKEGIITLEKNGWSNGGAGAFQYSYITTATIPATVRATWRTVSSSQSWGSVCTPSVPGRFSCRKQSRA